jgi:prepilin-type processing-associated H-X9-DG protein/prepilin-type N-terminal cleavage/methylation domain-containing protein
MSIPVRRQITSALSNRAFTVLELLVTMAIFGLLVGLLLPALMAARESARSLQCKNNLREIGVAVQQYHVATLRLPPAWTNSSDKISGYGWAVALLPYLEESDLGRSVDCNLPVSAAQNDTPRSTDLPIFRCPSDISDPTFELYTELPISGGESSQTSGISAANESTALVRLPAANYLGVFGTLEADETFPAPAGDGSIIANRVVRYSDLQRGQSHTLIVGERTTAVAPSTWFGVNFRGEDAACRLVGSAITRPNCDSCDECEFGSRHSGGSNFAWADGHVTLVLNDVDSEEYQQLAKRHID